MTRAHPAQKAGVSQHAGLGSTHTARFPSMFTYTHWPLKTGAHVHSVARASGRDSTSNAVAGESRDQIGTAEPSRIHSPQTDSHCGRLVTDGGRREVDPHIEPEFVGAHSDPVAETCQLWTGDEPTPCDNDATHTLVHYDGELQSVAACDECGEPNDVPDWGRQWSADREEIATDGGQSPADIAERIDFADRDPVPLRQAASALRSAADGLEAHTAREQAADDQPQSDGGFPGWTETESVPLPDQLACEVPAALVSELRRLDRQASADGRVVEIEDGLLQVRLSYDIDGGER